VGAVGERRQGEAEEMIKRMPLWLYTALWYCSYYAPFAWLVIGALFLLTAILP
jgi:hypothetical protein